MLDSIKSEILRYLVANIFEMKAKEIAYVGLSLLWSLALMKYMFVFYNLDIAENYCFVI